MGFASVISPESITSTAFSSGIFSTLKNSSSSGYALDVPTGIADGGGFKDWFITEFCRPGFTIELGLGKNPLPAADAAKINERVKEMLMLFIMM